VLNYYIYRLGKFLASSLPLSAAYLVAAFLGRVYYFLAFRDRRSVKLNLQYILPQASARQRRRISRKLFANFAKYLVDFFRLEKIDRKFIDENIQIENLHWLDQALARGKGVVILTAHLGNWELGGVILSQLGYPIWAVALPHKNKKVNDFFDTQRARQGIKVVPMGKAVRGCISQLRKKQLVALVGDRDFTEKGLVLDFFGKPTHFTEGPAALSLMTQASIVPAFLLRLPDNRFILKIEKPIDFMPTGNKAKDLADLVRLYRDIFEDYIRRYPEQWYLFRRFWIEPGP